MPTRRATSPKSYKESNRRSLRKNMAAKRAAGLRPVLLWLPKNVLRDADAQAKKKKLARQHVLEETIIDRFQPKPETPHLEPTT